MMLCLIVWGILGIVGFAITAIDDMRGKEYEKDVFIEDGYTFDCFMVCIVCGVFTFAISIIDLYKSKKNISDLSFTKLVYKIVNIGLKKDKNGENKWII